MKRQIVFYISIAIILCLLCDLHAVNGCYGPHITAEISKTKAYLNEEVTITGKICPPEPNATVRITFTRPDYTWIDRYVTADPETGEFTVTQKLDMIGYWNIFAIYGHLCDRLYVNVTDPENPLAPLPMPTLPPYRPNIPLITATATLMSVGVFAVITGRKSKTKNVSSLRLFIQLGIIFLIFFGMFIDHRIIYVPAEQISPHEFLIITNVFGVPIPEGLPVPFFGCYYPCGRTVTCALWELQTYLYPFWDVGRGWGVEYSSHGLMRLAAVISVIFISSLFFGRLFCGWVCPFGLYMDLLSKFRKTLRVKYQSFSSHFNEKFHQLGYVILALTITLSVIFGSKAIFGIQLLPETEKGGFIYAYFSVPFCRVCPMKPLCVLLQSSVGIMRLEWLIENTTGEFYHLGLYLTSINLLILGLVTVAAFFYRRIWCRICPLGALIALFNRSPPFKHFSGARLEKIEEKCTKCGICKRVCPMQVTYVYEKKGGDVTSSNCILCLRCIEMCPYEETLKLKLFGKTVFKSRNWLE